MLSLGTGSSCDICFESFNSTSKAPSSLTCGHVFCHMCIVQIFRLCPMCRVPFDSQAIIKLHIEAENSPEYLHCSQESIEQAKRLTASIYKIADDGIKESELQKLISEGRVFLGTQDRAMHRELRVLFRLIKYLNTVKLGSREQTHTVEILTAKVAGLEKEKEEIRNLLADTEATRQMERDTAYAVEESLRGHIKRIQEHSDKAASAYLALVQLYNKISIHNKELVNKLTNAGLSAGPIAEIYQGETENILTSDPASVENVAPMVDRASLQGVAVRNPHSSYLISPLPQFTVPLPNIDKFVPLPDLADDDEEEDEDDTEDEDEELNTPDSGSNQGQFPDQYRQYPTRSVTIPQPVPPMVVKVNYEASGLSRTAPYRDHRRRERSRSNPIDRVPLHRRNPQEDSIAPSTPPTPPFTNETEEPSSYRDPYVHPSSSASQQSRQSTSQSYNHYSSKHSTITSEYPPMPMNEDRLASHSHSQNNAHQMDPLVRLQNILSSDPPLSSSLPNSGSRHFPSSYPSRDRDRENRHPSPPPRSGSSTSHTQTPTPQTQQQQQQQSQAPYQPQSQAHHPSASHHNQPSAGANINININTSSKAISTASAHAHRLEEEKRRKYEEEKRKRQEERYQAEDRERERMQQQQQQQEHGSGSGTKYVSASAAAAAAVAASVNPNSNTGNGSYAQAQWRDQPQVYGANVQMSSSPGGMVTMPSSLSSSTSNSKRSGSISNVNMPTNPYGRM